MEQWIPHPCLRGIKKKLKRTGPTTIIVMRAFELACHPITMIGTKSIMKKITYCMSRRTMRASIATSAERRIYKGPVTFVPCAEI